MTQSPQRQYGAFSWNELKTNDTAAAKAFYSRLFGWQMRDEQTPEAVYTVLHRGEQSFGGITTIPENKPEMMPCWGAYVTVADVDKLTQQAELLGAQTVVAPCDIPDVGRFAVIRDPQGAMLSLITYSEA